MYCIYNRFNRKNIILADLWFDRSKPTMTTFLSSLVEEFNVLSTRGSVCMCVCVRVHVCVRFQRSIQDTVTRPLQLVYTGCFSETNFKGDKPMCPELGGG